MTSTLLPPTPPPPPHRPRPRPGPGGSSPDPIGTALARTGLDGPTYATAASSRLVQVRADLLPVEITAKRQTSRVKRRVALALLGVLALIVAGFGWSLWQKDRADDDLASAQDRVTALQAQQRQYQPLVTAQNGVQHIQELLTSLMSVDLPWSALLDTLRGAAPDSVRVTSVTGQLNASSGTATGLPALNTSGQSAIGTLTITGTAPDKATVAAYVDKLAGLKGVATPYPTSVATQTGDYNFSISALITADARGGRYAKGAK